MVVYVLERAGSRFVISVALQRLARGRVGLLVLGLSAGENEAEFVYTEGFVASPRTYRPLSEMPRIQAALYKTAYHHANVRIRARQPSEIPTTEPGKPAGCRSPLAAHRRQ
jgi:hypothetical protein